MVSAPPNASTGSPGGSTRFSLVSQLSSASVTAPPTHPVDVLLLLTHANHVLLALRDGTGYADGHWNLPSGKLEPDEDAISAVIREAREEVNLRLSPDELRLVTTVHHRNPSGHTRVGLVFTATHNPRQQGEPTNAEPHKCAKIEWFPTSLLPMNTYPYTTACVQAFSDGQPLVLDGWR